MKGVRLTISSYPYTKYAFASSEDTHTIFEALQHPYVFGYLSDPMTHAPPMELVRVIAHSPDCYTLGIAEHLVIANRMKPSDDEEKAMIESFARRQKGLFERAKLFYDILGIDMRKSKNVPFIFYPLLYDYSPEQVADQLFEIKSSISSDIQRIFFSLVFKFSRPNHKRLLEEAFDTCLLKWKQRNQTKDKYLSVYHQAADALWTYIEEDVMHKCIEHNTQAQSGEAWVNWVEKKGDYGDFVRICLNEQKREFQRQVSIFKHFIWLCSDRKKRKTTLLLF